MYERCFKRLFDLFLSLIGLIILSPILVILTAAGAIVMKGNPFFVQKRPGRKNRETGEETIISMLKFRSMTNERDNSGKLLPDEVRLNRYGRFLRASSLDELPELLLCVTGEMSLVGPRPLLVRDMVFMTTDQRRRHTVRPGITGLAQCSGRNNMTWEQKLDYDLAYIDQGITLKGDLAILFKTAVKVLQRDGITEEGEATATDFGDYLLQIGAVTKEEYDRKQTEAKELIGV